MTWHNTLPSCDRSTLVPSWGSRLRYLTCQTCLSLIDVMLMKFAKNIPRNIPSLSLIASFELSVEPVDAINDAAWRVLQWDSRLLLD